MILHFPACMDAFTYLIPQIVTTQSSQQFESRGGIDETVLIRSGYKRNLFFWLNVPPSSPTPPPLPLNTVSRRVCTRLGFLWNLKEQIRRKRKETPLSLPVGFRVRLRHPIRMWQYCDRLAPTAVSKWYIILTGPRCSADKEWHLPSRPQAKLIFKWHPGGMQGHYFRASIELRKTQV